MKKLKRSSNRIVGGVLGGIADYFETDPVWIRLVYILFALINFMAAFILYLVGLFIIPKDEIIVEANVENQSEEVKVIKNRDNRSLTIIGLVLILVGAIILFEQLYDIRIWWNIKSFYYDIKNYLWPILLMVLGIWVIYRGNKKSN